MRTNYWQGKRRRVDPVQNREDKLCLTMAMSGKSNKAIIGATKLTPGMISYRLRSYGVSRMEYRDGTSAFAKQVDRATKKMAEKALLSHLRQHVGKGEPYG